MAPSAYCETALTGASVLELGDGLASAYAGKLLVDLGATVERLVAPGHDSAASDGLLRHLHRDKRSVVLDLRDASARGRFGHVVERCELVIESLGPGGLEALEVPIAELGAARAVVRISPFGQSGPYRDRAASSLVLQAAGGWAARIGTPEGPPYYVGGCMEQYVAGSYAATAALTAWKHARQIREPVTVDVSVFECIAGTVPYPMLQKITFDRLGFPIPQRYQPIPGIMPCRDGHVGISALTGQHWNDVCALLGVGDLGAKMREVTLRGPEWERFVAVAEPWLRERDAADIVETFQAMRVPAVPIGNGANLPILEPFASRGFYARDDTTGAVRPRSPFRFTAAAGTEGSSTSQTRHGAASAPTSRGWGGGRPGLPLSGLRVLDLTTFWAGPYLTMYLASMGADVIKVESPKRPDGFRFVAAFPELGERWWEQSGVFHATNLGKRAVTLDLDHPRGIDLALRLVTDADVIAENFSPRVVEHFGLDYPAIRAVNPRAIVVRMPGFGLTGACRDWVGWALTFEQLAGCAERTGEANGRRFAPGGFADPAVGMHAALAVQAALLARERSGEGCQIEIAQVEVVAAMTADQVIRHSLTGRIASRTGNRSEDAAPQGIYRAAGTDEWLALTVRHDDDWRALCRALGREDWAGDAELGSVAGRMLRHDEIDGEIACWTRARSASAMERTLVAAGIPAARLLKTADFYADPQLAARRHFHALDHAVAGRLEYPNWPLRFSFGPHDPYAAGAPTLGQHNREILRDVLGLADAEIDALEAARVIAESIA